MIADPCYELGTHTQSLIRRDKSPRLCHTRNGRRQISRSGFLNDLNAVGLGIFHRGGDESNVQFAAGAVPMHRIIFAFCQTSPMDSLFRLGKKHKHPGAFVGHDLMSLLFRFLWEGQTVVVFVVSRLAVHENHVVVSAIVPDVMECELPGVARAVTRERHLFPMRE